MARMSIDDKFLRDPRVAVLGKLCGWSVRETRGALLDVWAVCYDQVTALISRAMIDVAADLDGFSEKLIEAELGVLDRSGKVRVVGASDRIEYLDHKRKAGRQGGLNSAKVRNKEVKQTSSTVGSNSQALGNPIPTVTVTASVPDSASALATDPKKEDSATSSLALTPGPVKASKPKKPKAGLLPTPAELASVRVVLGKLGEYNGVAYTCCDDHVALIVNQLRRGLDEMDLRKVVAYCGDRWEDDEKMRQHLCPETLFGPRTISKYLDPARAKFAAYSSAPQRTQPPTMVTQEILAVVRGAQETT